MSYYDLEKEKNAHPYDIYGGNVIEEIHGNKKFLLKQAMHYFVDAYGFDGSIDLSHYETGNYYEVCDNIPLDDDFESLDLTWMDSNDIVDFNSYRGEHHKLVKSIDMNINNMAFSHLDSMDKVTLNVYPGESNIGLIKQIQGFKYFLHCNDDVVAGLNLIGFSSIMTTILSNYAERYGLTANNKSHVRIRQ